MKYVCDICDGSFSTPPEVISAIEWNKEQCPQPGNKLAVSEYFINCSFTKCKYNIEGEVCIEFNVCSKCASDTSALNKAFKNVKKFM